MPLRHSFSRLTVAPGTRDRAVPCDAGHVAGLHDHPEGRSALGIQHLTQADPDRCLRIPEKTLFSLVVFFLKSSWMFSCVSFNGVVPLIIGLEDWRGSCCVHPRSPPTPVARLARARGRRSGWASPRKPVRDASWRRDRSH